MKALIFLALLSVPLASLAADGVVLVQKDRDSENLFFAQDAAKELFELIRQGVPTQGLPNGSAVDGQFLSCSNTFGADLAYHAFCATVLDDQGLERVITPTFAPDQPSAIGTATTELFPELGIARVRIAGDAAGALFARLAGDSATKGAKNIVCTASECSFFTTERAYAEPLAVSCDTENGDHS